MIGLRGGMGLYSDPCRTWDNPFGHIEDGSGDQPGGPGNTGIYGPGSPYDPAMGFRWDAANHTSNLPPAQNNALINLIQSAYDHVEAGQWPPCPQTPQQAAAQIAGSVFRVPTPAELVVNNTPLWGGWLGGSVPLGGTPAAPLAPVTVNPATGQATAVDPATGQTVNVDPATGVPLLSSFSFSSIPWWGWAGGAAAVLFLIGGSK